MYDIQVSDVIHALRCSSSEKAVCRGDSCPYFYKEAKETEEAVAAFLEKHGYTRDQLPVDFFDGCDVDRIARDAADRLEEYHGRTQKP